jgi:serine/threonine protein kinase
MHRDIKPPNILVTRDDFAYLVDFGIASATTDEKLTQLGTAVGTWKYMAPERFSNDEVTYRADIYALACVLHECLTGAPPYKSDSAGTLVTSHLRDPIPQPSAARPGIPRAFDAVVARGMAKKPEDRYASAGDLAMAAHDALSEPDQDHAVNILRRSQEATLPGGGLAPPPPPPSSQPPRFTTPPPAHTPVPTPPSHPGWAPASGPMPASQPIPAPQYYQGNWGGTPPPSTPPPQQFVGQTPWNQPPAPRKRNPWPIVAGVAALVIVLVAAAIGIWVATSSDDNKHTTASTTTVTPSSTTPTTTTTSSSELQNKLRSLLPAGYASGVCKATTPKPTSIWVNALAMLDCGQNTNQGGPARAVYGLFADVDTLNKAFTDDIGANGSQLMNCPGEGQSPDGWHYDKTPNDTAGQIACATYKNQANVIWSNVSKLTLSDTFGDGTIDDLHTWWAKFSG